MREEMSKPREADTALFLSESIAGSKVRLCRKRLADAPNDYAWKTDPELTRLDAAPLLTVGFTEYLSSYAAELNSCQPAKYQFAIKTLDGKHIGNCAYYDINEVKREAEIGILIGDRDYWGKGYGSDTVKALVSDIFCQTKLKRIYLKTLHSNGRAQRCFSKCGFTVCGHFVKGKSSFLLMELRRERWPQRQEQGQPAIRVSGVE